jgi:hypothetical protein
MTLVASIFFLSALVMSVFAIWATINRAMPRINAVIAEEFGPVVRSERRISFGKMKHAKQSSGDVIFLRPVLLKQEFKLAA